MAVCGIIILPLIYLKRNSSKAKKNYAEFGTMLRIAENMNFIADLVNHGGFFEYLVNAEKANCF